MSIKVMSKVWEASMVSDHTELILLLAMADFADDEGCCFPSVRKLAKKSRISERQAYRVIKSLCEKQWIELVEQGGVRNGKNVSNRYRILVAGGGADTMSPHGPDTASPHGLTPSQNGTDTVVSSGVVTQLRQTIRQFEASKKTTTRATPDLFSRPNHPVVVALSSLAMEGDEPTDIVDKLTEEFGLSIPQGREVEAHLASKGAGYVIEKAEIVRAKKSVKNLAGAFIKALVDDWKAPKSISDQRPVKKPSNAEPENEEPQLTFEERQAHLKEMRAKVSGR